MAVERRRLAPSEAKTHFMTRLGLDQDKEADQCIYQSMMSEAAAGYRRICETRAALLWKMKDDPSVQPPFTFCQIREDAMLTEIRRIYELSTVRTRALYNLAEESEGACQNDNWIIRWLLWHAFRYRDSRNNKPHQVSILDTSPMETEFRNSEVMPPRERFWDPVREC